MKKTNLCILCQENEPVVEKEYCSRCLAERKAEIQEIESDPEMKAVFIEFERKRYNRAQNDQAKAHIPSSVQSGEESMDEYLGKLPSDADSEFRDPTMMFMENIIPLLDITKELERLGVRGFNRRNPRDCQEFWALIYDAVSQANERDRKQHTLPVASPEYVVLHHFNPNIRIPSGLPPVTPRRYQQLIKDATEKVAYFKKTGKVKPEWCEKPIKPRRVPNMPKD